MAAHEGYMNLDERVVLGTSLGLLLRETLLPATVWRDAASDFAGKENDTVTLRLPAYGVAGKRKLRQDGGRYKSKLYERGVPITLDDELFHDVVLTGADQTLDLQSVTGQVIAPSILAIREGLEQEVADAFETAEYENSVELSSADLDSDGNLPVDLLFDVRRHLNDANIPQSNRFVVVGSALETMLLKGSDLKTYAASGDSLALRQATVGTVAGFGNIFVSNFIDPYMAYAYHRTAVAIASRAPVVPRGVAWGGGAASDGFAIRVMEHLGESGGVPVNRVYTDTWVGTNHVTDVGSYNELGKFIPAVDPEDSGEDAMFVRAVKIDGSDLAES